MATRNASLTLPESPFASIAPTSATNASGISMKDTMFESSWPYTTNPHGNPQNATTNSEPAHTTRLPSPNSFRNSRHMPRGNTTAVSAMMEAFAASVTALPKKDATTAVTTCQAEG